MNIKFKRIEIKNFMSVGNVPMIIDLDTDLVTMIMGDNRDGSDGSRNGTGKTTIFNALSYVLWDKTLMDVKKDGVVNLTNKSDCVVTLDFEIDGVELRLARGRKPNVLSLTKDGQPYTPARGSVEAISDLLGIDFDLFNNIIMLTNESGSFHKMKGAQQKAFIENLLQVKVLSERAAVLKEYSKDNAVSIRLEQQKQEEHEKYINQKKSDIARLSQQADAWRADQENAARQLEARMNDLKSIDVQDHREKAAQLEALKHELECVNQELNAATIRLEKEHSVVQLEESKAKQFDHELSKIDSEIRQLVAQKQNIDNQISSLETHARGLAQQIEGIDNQHAMLGNSINESHRRIEQLTEQQSALDHGICPVCSGPYVDEAKKAQLEQEKAQVQAQITKFENQREDLIKSRAAVIAQKDDIPNKIETLAAQKPALDNEIDSINARRPGVEAQKNEVMRHVHELRDQLTKVEAEVVPIMERERDIKNRLAQFQAANPNILNEVQLTEISVQIAAIEGEIEAAKERMLTNPYHDQIETLRESIFEFDLTALAEFERLDAHYKILVKLLTDSKSFIRKAIIDQYVPFINHKISEYLDALESPHTVEIGQRLGRWGYPHGHQTKLWEPFSWREASRRYRDRVGIQGLRSDLWRTHQSTLCR